MICDSKDLFKIFPNIAVSNIHNDVSRFQVDGMIENVKRKILH